MGGAKQLADVGLADSDIACREIGQDEGAWADNGTLELDRIVIAEVMTEGLDRDWWRDFRERLERQLAQDEIVIRATEIDRL